MARHARRARRRCGWRCRLSAGDLRVALRDSTLREALDTPGVAFSFEDRLDIARALADAGVPEAEIVAPSRVAADLAVARALARNGWPLRRSGLVYANGDDPTAQVAEADALDHVDLLMPLSPLRPPHESSAKVAVLLERLAQARRTHPDVGVGFPHATQAALEFVADFAARSA